MRHIQFKKLFIKNFLSIGKEPVIIDFLSGINVITGINHDKEDSKNGVGKSSIVDALYFSLFGTTIRELSKDFIINSFNKEKCEVSLELQINSSGGSNTYIINRTLQPSKCSITKDGVDVTRSTLPKTNEYIQQLVNSTGKIFQNSVVMTINNTVPFMAQSKVDKRKFIESVLKLEVFSEMLLKARDEHNDLKREYEVLYAKQQAVEKSLTANKQQLDLFETNKQKRIREVFKKIEANLETLEQIKKSIINIPSNTDELINNKANELKDKQKDNDTLYTLALQKVTEIQTEANFLHKQLKDIEKVGAVCICCKRPYSDEDNNHREESKKDLQDKINDLIEQGKKCKTELTTIESDREILKKGIVELQSKKDKIKDIIQQNNNFQSKTLYITENNEQCLKEQQAIESENNTVLENIVNSSTLEFEQHTKDLTEADHKLSVLECVKFVVSEEGVKSYIVKKILKLLNTRLAYYLNELHANCICLFDEFFDEVITDEKGEIKSYFNFSGGERKRIDLACLFAFLDIRRMQGDINFNTIFYDELLDSSLDDKGVELVMKVLRERLEKYNEGCYIITHRSNAINSKVDSVIHLEKRNGFTYILNNNNNE